MSGWYAARLMERGHKVTISGGGVFPEPCDCGGFRPGLELTETRDRADYSRRERVECGLSYGEFV